jgi:hypothetical protein
MWSPDYNYVSVLSVVTQNIYYEIHNVCRFVFREKRMVFITQA